MNCDHQYDTVCREEFKLLHRKLDQMDEAIRGNGKPGIQRRLDRLESSDSTRARALWMLFGAALSCAVALAMKLLGG